MSAGALRTIVTFQQPTETSTGDGGRTVAWGGDKVVHCQLTTQSGREQVLSGRMEATAMANLRARAPAVAGVDESWRAVIGGVAWNIRSATAFSDRGEWTDFIIERGGKGVGA